MKTIRLTESEMAQYLTQRNIDIFSTEDDTVINYENLKIQAKKFGFELYTLSGVGGHDQTHLFIKEMDYRAMQNNEHTYYTVWGRMGMSGYLTQQEVDMLNEHPAVLNDLIKQGAFTFDGETYFPDALDENKIIDYLEINL